MADEKVDASKYGCYVEQLLRVEIPEGLMTRLMFSKDEVVALQGYLGAGVEVKYPGGGVAGTLVYYPGAPLKSLKYGKQ